MNRNPNIRKPLPDELPGTTTLLLAGFALLVLFTGLLLTVVLPAEKGIDPTGVGMRLNLTRMGAIKTAMTEDDAPLIGRPQRNDVLSIELAPGEGREIKLEMLKGFEASYSWETSGGVIYHDTHGDMVSDHDFYVSYKTADGVDSDKGSIKAVFNGKHGWFWKNNGEQTVAITLQASGEYVDILKK